MDVPFFYLSILYVSIIISNVVVGEAPNSPSLEGTVYVGPLLGRTEFTERRLFIADFSLRRIHSLTHPRETLKKTT
jgi:hypothetical protein